MDAVAEDAIVVACVAPVVAIVGVTLWVASRPLSEEERAQREADTGRALPAAESLTLLPPLPGQEGGPRHFTGAAFIFLVCTIPFIFTDTVISVFERASVYLPSLPEQPVQILQRPFTATASTLMLAYCSALSRQVVPVPLAW